MALITFNNFNWSFILPIQYTFDLPEGVKFEGGDYDTLLNNVEFGRPNSLLFKVDYPNSNFSPSNLNSVLSKTTKKAQTPDYNPLRYRTNRLSSVTYNKYTPQSVIQFPTNIYYNRDIPITFINQSTGIWEGDKSFGKLSVIDKYPKYIAYFKTSYENRAVWNTYQYDIEQLIEIPNYDITQDPNYQPQSIKLEGNNDNLYEIVGSFERGRLLDVSYNNILKDGIDYSLIKKDKQKILEPGIEYFTLISNQTDTITTNNSWSLNRFLSGEKIEFDSDYDTEPTMLLTGSNCFYLSGSSSPLIYFTNNADFNIEGEGFMGLQGPHLSIIHTYNQCLYNQEYYTATSGSVGVISGLDPLDKTNYMKWSPSDSGIPFYKDSQEPFLILKNDEIRVQYQYPSGSVLINAVENYIVKSNPTSREIDTPNDYSYLENDSSSAPGTVKLDKIYDVIEVYPNPEDSNIYKGIVTSFTVRRRKESDSQILITTPPPLGSKGILTPSGGGFLIPEDLSQIQRKNILKIINILRSQNSFELESGIGNNILRLDPNTGDIYVWV